MAADANPIPSLTMDNLLIFLFSCLSGYASGQLGPTPVLRPAGYEVQFPAPSDQVIRYDHSPDLVTDKVEIIWVNSTTSSIAIQWQFPKNYVIKGQFQGSEVEYFVPGGKFTSHLLPPKTLEFIFQNLVVATTYTVCVNMYEVRNIDLTNGSQLMHSKCLQLDTIPYIRADSIATLILVICYFVFMSLIGYFQWKKKVIELQNRKPCRAAENNDDSPDTSVRWKDVEERQRLYLPGSSIEETR